MPELPEVETVVRSLAPRVTGCLVKGVRTSGSRVFRGTQAELERTLPGSHVQAVRRYGKNILIETTRGTLRIHLGMTGRLLFDAEQATHRRATLWLRPPEGASVCIELVFDDIRQFGRFEMLPPGMGDSLALGPEPLEIERGTFLEALAQRNGSVKSLLLNQSFLRGMGNIYTDEALFLARIHPMCPACEVSRKKGAALHEAMQALLTEAIAAGGSSISDYVDAEGRRGGFQLRHQVYGREGEGCSRCAAPIRRIVIAQRGTHYCPRCQRMPGRRGSP